MMKLLIICFVYKIYFNIGELGRFLLDQYEVAPTPQNLTAVNVALNSGALKVPSATSTRQRGKGAWTAFLKVHPLWAEGWAALILLMTTSHPDLLLWALTITFKDYTWTARIARRVPGPLHQRCACRPCHGRVPGVGDYVHHRSCAHFSPGDLACQVERHHSSPAVHASGDESARYVHFAMEVNNSVTPACILVLLDAR